MSDLTRLSSTYGPRIKTVGDDLKLPPQAAQAIGMVLHEVGCSGSANEEIYIFALRCFAEPTRNSASRWQTGPEEPVDPCCESVVTEVLQHHSNRNVSILHLGASCLLRCHLVSVLNFPNITAHSGVIGRGFPI